MSRPPKLTLRLQEQIVAAVAAGNYPEVAAAALGVRRSTFHEWMQRGAGKHATRKTTPLYARFFEAMERAVAISEVQLRARLVEFERGWRPGKRDPRRRVKTRMTLGAAQAVQWTLSRRFPERWAQRPPPATATIELEDVGPPKIVITLAPEDDEETGTQSPREDWTLTQPSTPDERALAPTWRD